MFFCVSITDKDKDLYGKGTLKSLVFFKNKYILSEKLYASAFLSGKFEPFISHTLTLRVTS